MNNLLKRIGDARQGQDVGRTGQKIPPGVTLTIRILFDGKHQSG